MRIQKRIIRKLLISAVFGVSALNGFAEKSIELSTRQHGLVEVGQDAVGFSIKLVNGATEVKDSPVRLSVSLSRSKKPASGRQKDKHKARALFLTSA